MDDQRFDDLSRRLATGVSRRQVLRALAGGVLGGVAGALGLGRAAAACATDRDCPPGERCDATTASCVPRGNGRAAGQSQSQSVSAAAPCSSDAACAPNETCVEGVCTPRGGSCTRGSACSSDATCCGGEVCDTSIGVCVGAGGPCTNTVGTCFDSLDCCGNEECLGGICQQVAGGCAPGAICTADAECCGGQVCAGGTCVRAARPAGCPEDQVRCSGTCVDVSNDRANCGACDVGCAEGLTCVGGACVSSGVCEPWLVDCSGECVPLNFDPNNCGACGNVCASGICLSGICSSSETCEDGRYVCPDAYVGRDICCDSCSRCTRSGEGEWYCETTCLGPTGIPSACAPCLDGACGEDPCDYSSESCNQVTRQCEPFPNRVCFGTDTVCPPNHVCGSNADGSLTVCCPVDEFGSANTCGISYEDGTEGLGCQCTTESGEQGCMAEDGVCCTSFSAPGVCS